MRLTIGDSPQSIAEIVSTSGWNWEIETPLDLEKIVLDELSRLIEFVCTNKDQDYLTIHLFDSGQSMDDMELSINFVFDDLWLKASLKALLEEYREHMVYCFEDMPNDAPGDRWRIEHEMQATALSHAKFLRTEADKIEATLKACEPTSK